MGWFRNFIENIKDRFGGNRKLLAEGESKSVSNFDEGRNKFMDEVQNQARLSSEEVRQKENELAKKAAYNCLADMIVNQKFNETSHLGESFEKSKYKLQAEEYYKEYGHGIEIPVQENILIVCREIQYLLHEKQEVRDNYGLVQDKQLEQFLKQNNMDIKTLITKDNGKMLSDIAKRFEMNGSYIDFNTEDKNFARSTMEKAIMDTLEGYSQEYTK